MDQNRTRPIWSAGLLALAMVLAAYANSFGNSFHFDDFHTITDNPAIRSLGNIPHFFKDATTFSVLPANRTYRPLVSASLAMDYALGHGYVPFWFHLSTFLWFTILLGCLFLLYRQAMERSEPTGANVYVALLGAAWFGLHPAMAETVNYVIQRGDLYCTLGCVGALVLYARYPRWRRAGVYLLPLLAALLCKPPAAVFPVLLLFWVFFFETAEGPGRWKTSVLAALPSLLVTGAALSLQSAMTPKSFAPSILIPAEYRLTQPFVWMRYFGQFFLPLHLNVDSDLQPFHAIDGRAVLGMVFVLALVAAILATARHRRMYPIAFGLIWFAVTQIPTSAYALSEVENDHRMFFSFAGLMLAVVWAGWLGVQRALGAETLRWSRPLLVVCGLLLCGYGWGVHVRNRAWRDEESLWRDDVEKSPHNGRGLMIYGLTQMNKGAYPEALEFFTRALEYTPNYATLEINLGVVNGAMGRNAEAEKHFERAISLGPQDDEGHAFYGRWLLAQGRIGEAVEEERAAVRNDPQRPLNHDMLLAALTEAGDPAALKSATEETLAMVPDDASARRALQGDGGRSVQAGEAVNVSLQQYQRGEYEASLRTARRALALDGTSPQAALAYNNIGASQGALGRWDEAIAAEKEALRLDPGLQIAKNNLALYEEKKRSGEGAPDARAMDLINQSLALNQEGRFEESVGAARNALKLDPRSAVAWNNIAADYEAMQRWDEAIAAAQKALALKPDFQLAKNNLAWAEQQKRAAK